jgi:acyl-CoA synthetase
MQTSGTTRRGSRLVVVPHAAVARNVHALLRGLALTAADTLVQGSPAHFDPAVDDICLALLRGARLVVPTAAVRLRPRCFAAALAQVTAATLTPSTWMRLGTAAMTRLCETLNVLVLGGEPFPAGSLVRQWWTASSCTRLFNVYGTTEASVWASLYELHKNDTAIEFKGTPLGAALDGTRFVLREETGELWLERCAAEACVLWQDGVFTRATCVPTGDVVRRSEKIGQLVFVGRCDFRVKRDGHIVDLPAITETLLAALSAHIHFCHVISVDGCFSLGRNVLVAVVVCRSEVLDGGSEPSAKRAVPLLACIRGVLQGPTCPDDVLELADWADIPLTHTGKIDERALSAIYTNTVEHRMQGLDAESTLWNTLESVGLSILHKELSFAAAGGDSQMAVLFAVRLQHQWPSVVDAGAVIDRLFSAQSLHAAVQSLCASGWWTNDDVPVPVPATAIATSATVTPANEGSTAAALLHGMKILWRQELGKCIDAPPLLAAGLVFIGAHSHRFAAFDATTGHRLWEVNLGGRIEGGAVLSQCRQFVVVGSHAHCVHVLSVVDGSTNWVYPVGAEIKSTPCVDPATGFVIVTCHDGWVRALDIVQRQLAWDWSTVELAGTSSGLFASPVVHGLYVFGATLSGWVFALHMDGNTPTLAWKYKAGGAVFTTPCVVTSASLLVVGTVTGALIALDFASGTLKWTITLPGPVFSSPTTDTESKLIVVGCHAGIVACLDAGSGREYWSTSLGTASVFAGCSVLAGMPSSVMAVNTAGRLCRLELESGNVLSDLTLSGQVYSSPRPMRTDAGLFLVVGCRDDYLYMISC